MIRYAFNAMLANPKDPSQVRSQLGIAKGVDLETVRKLFQNYVLKENPGFTLKQLSEIHIPDL